MSIDQLPHRPGPDSRPVIRLSRGKKILFALVTVVVAVAVLEGVLALLGVRPLLYAHDPYVGFSSEIPLFVETTAPDGTTLMVTGHNKLTFFNAQTFPKDKPADTFRIFAVGGSTTYGHPYEDGTSFAGWLRELLPALAPGRRFEVINAGGISYASYRVAKLMEELIRYEPDLFIIYSGHNEFLEQRTYASLRDLPETVRRAGALVSRFRTAAVIRKAVTSWQRPARPAAAMLPGEVVTLLDNTVGPDAYARNDAQTDVVLRHFRFNLARMVDIARSAGAQAILVTPASNLRSCSPFKSEHRAGLSEAELGQWKRLYEEARQSLAGGRDDLALAALDRAAEIDDRHALVHYARGQILERLGRFGEAKPAFVRARDEDVCPLRALSAVVGIVAAVAADLDVAWCDFVSLQEAQSEQGIPGAAVFLDHVHPTIPSHRLLALELLRVMQARGLVKPSWDDAAIAHVTERVLATVNTERQSVALMNLSKVLGWAGRLREAHRLAVAAAELETPRADVPYQAGLCAQLLGNVDEAIRYYRRAVALDPTAAEVQGNLGVALEDKGELSEACGHLEAAIQHGDAATSARNRKNLDRVRAKMRREGVE